MKHNFCAINQCCTNKCILSVRVGFKIHLTRKRDRTLSSVPVGVKHFLMIPFDIFATIHDDIYIGALLHDWLLMSDD